MKIATPVLLVVVSISAFAAAAAFSDQNDLDNLDKRLDALQELIGRRQQQAEQSVHFEAHLFSPDDDSAYVSEGVSPIPFTDAVKNDLEVFDLETSLFTAPFDGVFYFKFGAECAMGDGHCHVSLDLNGQVRAQYHQDGVGPKQLYFFSLLDLSEGDTVGVSTQAVDGGSSDVLYYGHNPISFYGQHLN